MEYSIHFTYRNPEFDQSHADEFHDGQESETNIRDLWEDELEVQGEVIDFKIRHKQPYILQAQQDEEIIDIPIDNMTLFDFQLADGNTTTLAASNKLVKDIEIKDLRIDAKVVYVLLKGKEEPISPFPGLYVKPSDWPGQE